ncbi:SusC/RagA family TonB-linked outer membrane protein [Hymenobacter jeollabukensis]|uniref:TonB-dependent receptor n=1 Tax=Hymenobacter jeollabukensis TaxID=2025313 RepID=A0A5R8WRP0_9BACT|nr:TonB-dependent receptor [Hymenobacter jeollabukensis]TLM93061.1 TonB-dependent receptor [Hymenobacter jeollabukensis]
MKKHLFLAGSLLSMAVVANAQQGRRVSGVVRSAKGEELPGVTVVVKGTTNGATTDPEGKFSLNVTGDNPVLRISYIGFEPQDVTVGSSSDLTVTLKEDAKLLNDVVVIGYQEVQRRDVTGSVSSVNAQQIKDIPVNSAAEALTGRLAGVQLTSTEGQPGSDVTIRVRGGGSITQSNNPLFIVDGVQVENALATISPQDIQSVDVLKDAAATAIYGARGANGVVIITTKIGREGKTTVTYNGFAGVRKLARKLELLNPYDFVAYQYERAQNLGGQALTDFRDDYGTLRFDSLDAFRSVPNVDWQDRVFGQEAFQQTHNVSITGGSKGANYALSLTRNIEDGIQRGSGFDRYLVNFRFENKVSDKFRFGFNARYNAQTTKGAGTNSTGTAQTSRLRNTIQYRPFEANIGNSSQEDFAEDLASNGPRLVNPLTLIDAEYRRNMRRVLNLNGTAAYTLLKNLTFRTTVGVETTGTENNAFNGTPTSVARQNGNQPTASIFTSQLVTLNNSNVLSYALNKGKHSFDALVGHEVYTYRTRNLGVSALYLPTTITAERALASLNLASPPSGTVQAAPDTRQTQSRILSGFGRLNYSFADKYLLTATFRGDGSSKFAEGRRWGYFPAASVAWRISQEEFMKSFEQVSDLKLRLSYGLAGNNRVDDFLYVTTFATAIPNASGTGTTPVQYGLNGALVPGVASPTLANEFLKWETTVSRNLGVDLGLFSNRVQLSADVYYNSTRDLLLNQNIPSTSGYSVQQRNVGRTANRGVELQVSGTVLQTPDFSWTATANVSFNRNRVEDLGDSDFFLFNSNWAGSDGADADYIVRKGQPVGQIYGYQYDGFYTANDFLDYAAAGNRWTLRPGIASTATVSGANAVRPGAPRYRDLNGDGNITADGDRTVIGNTNPKAIGGFNQQFTYKNFDASIFLNWVLGNDIYNANRLEYTSGFYANTNLLASINDNRYRNINAQGQLVTSAEELNALNANATRPAPSFGRFLPSSDIIESGSFLRLNNVTIGYTLPKTLTAKAKMSTARLYVTGNNLYVLTKYSGFDPEVSARPNLPLAPGLDYAAYPRSRAYLFGVNVSF